MRHGTLPGGCSRRAEQRVEAAAVEHQAADDRSGFADSDEAREQEAEAWAEALITDVASEPRSG